MHKIQANASGTRSIEVSDNHLQTIDDYQLFRDLIDSNGIVDETVLDKLKFNVRSLLESSTEQSADAPSENGSKKQLLDLCLDVIYHKDMKAFGLQQLVLLYINWKETSAQAE